MGEIKLLDCTLREAPVGIMGDDVINSFIALLEKANIDIIECAFLSTLYDKYVIGSTHFTTIEQIEKFLTKKKNNVIYTACFNQSEFNYATVPDYNGNSIDGLRFVLEKGNLDAAISGIKKIKDKGYKIFVQHRDTKDYSDNEILQIVETINKLQPYAYSIVDTYGSIYSEDLLHIINLIQPVLDTSINWGFHSHNNLFLATANAQNFIRIASKNHNIFVDGSILGCGIGAGNALTELLAQYLNTKYGANYNMDALFDIIDDLMPSIQNKCQWGYSIPNFISGITGAVTTHAAYISETFKPVPSKTLLDLMKTMDVTKIKRFNNNFAAQYYFEYYKKNTLPLSQNAKLQLIKKHIKVVCTKPKVKKIVRHPYRVYKKLKYFILKII